MSIPREPEPATLVFSILSARFDCFWSGLKDELAALFGPPASESGEFAFTHTGYYDAELGSPIARRIVAFERLIAQDELVAVKLAANALEQEHASAGRRLFNLDPGLLTLERLVLATGKSFTHRIYLGRGIWADLTLIWQNGAWQRLPWTFPDYAGQELQACLTGLRSAHKARLSAWRIAAGRPA
jgi:hypothetical protein